MTNQQLKSFYAFIESDVSHEKGDLSMLKKTLLLEIKSSETGFIKIDEQEYSKNDILNIFEAQESSNQQKSHIQLGKLEEIIPEILLLKTPLKIVNAPDLSQKEELWHEIKHFAEHESAPFFSSYTQALKKHLNEDMYGRTSYLTAFLPFFSEDNQHKAKRIIIQILESKLLDLQNDQVKSNSPVQNIFLSEGYIKTLRDVASDDNDFLEFQLEVMTELINNKTWGYLYEACKAQLHLPHDEYHREWIIDTMTTAKYNPKRAVIEGKRARFSDGGKWMLGLIVVVIVLALFLKLIFPPETKGRMNPVLDNSADSISISAPGVPETISDEEISVSEPNSPEPPARAAAAPEDLEVNIEHEPNQEKK